MADRLDAATRAMEIQVDLANPGGVILPGMFGTALLTLENREDVVAVPVQAVAGHDTKPTVLVVNGQNVLEERAVTLGLETPEWAEITAGITEGEAVVVGNRSGLKAGKTVTPAGKGR
jgi:multidrug efflux pump subunit AcrA (membrane-fusion protein)